MPDQVEPRPGVQFCDLVAQLADELETLYLTGMAQETAITTLRAESNLSTATKDWTERYIRYRWAIPKNVVLNRAEVVSTVRDGCVTSPNWRTLPKGLQP